MVSSHLDTLTAAEPIGLDDVIPLAELLEVLACTIHGQELAELGDACDAMTLQKLKCPPLAALDLCQVR